MSYSNEAVDAAFQSADTKGFTGRIRIIRIPVGEAPDEIKLKWIGLVLPCFPTCGYHEDKEKGVLTDAESDRRRTFSVPQKETLEILAGFHPEAAAWWRAHGFPQDGPNACFGFGEDEADIESGVVYQKIRLWDDFGEGNPNR